MTTRVEQAARLALNNQRSAIEQIVQRSQNPRERVAINKDFGDETTSERPAEEPTTQALRLLVLGSNEDTIASYPLPDEGRVVIGRGEGADLRINDASISRVHAALSVRAVGLELEDLGSSNGTVV